MSGLKLIFFDVGSTFGYAHNCRGGVEHGELDFTTDADRPRRFSQTYHGLDALLRSITGDAVVFERPFARGQHATRSLWGQAGIIELVAFDRGFPVLDITPKEVKQFATGKGTASKEEMNVAARRLLGIAYADPMAEHEADAICGLFYSLKHVSKPETPSGRQKNRRGTR